MKKKNERFLNVAICCLSLFVASNSSMIAQDEMGTSAVPLYDGSKSKRPAPKSKPPAQKPAVSSFGRVTTGAKPAVSSIGRVSTSSGLIYTIDQANNLKWYRHDGRGNGSFTWASNSGSKVGQGWDVKQVFSGDNGVIYTIDHANNLMWYCHDGRGDGSFRWASNSGSKVGQGWDVNQVFSD
jgi:hypothetical protein